MRGGNPNPNRDNLKPFAPGQSGNPNGLSKEQWAKRKANAEKALMLQGIFLDAVTKHVETLTTDEAKQAVLRSDILNLTNSALDRHYGKPQQQLDLLSSDNSQGPTTIRLVAATRSDDSDDG